MVGVVAHRIQPFKLRISERPMHIDSIGAEVEDELKAELAKRPQARPVPPAPTTEVSSGTAAH